MALNREKSPLGRGLASLLPEIEEDQNQKGFSFIKISKIRINPYQPRKNISVQSVMELSESIKEKGVIMPITVVVDVDNNEEYVLVAGERRLQAATLAGFEEIPALIRELTEKEIAELAIIENIHRKDLNPIEEGFAFLRLHTEFNMTADEIATKISKTKAYVDNKMRLTKLPQIIQNAISVGEITENHGKALLGLGDEEAMIAALKIVIRNGLNSQKTEELVRQIKAEKLAGKKSLYSSPTMEWEQKFNYIKDELSDSLGSNVKLKRNRKQGGSILINFNDDDELVSLYKRLRQSQK